MLKVTSNDKTNELIRMALGLNGIEGDCAECGVYQGGNLFYLATRVPTRRWFGFDTFKGLPPESWCADEPHRIGDFADTDWSETWFNFSMQRNVTFVRGVFPLSAKGLEDKRFAFVYVDFDFYKSTADAIDWFLPRMSRGGIMAFDDYEWPQCPGVKRALDERHLAVHIPVPHLAVIET